MLQNSMKLEDKDIVGDMNDEDSGMEEDEAQEIKSRKIKKKSKAWK